MTPDDRHERAATQPVCGIDEAGRGPLAGPVVAAAVLFPAAGIDPALAEQLRDSKQLSGRRRETLFAEIIETLPHGIGQASVAEIDRTNILAATHLAMQRALFRLSRPVRTLLVDGNQPLALDDPAIRIDAIVKGDCTCVTIAAASILAKVTRDRLMARLDEAYPAYGWRRNKGYGTAEHRAALKIWGVTPHHRTSFAPVRELCATGDWNP